VKRKKYHSIRSHHPAFWDKRVEKEKRMKSRISKTHCCCNWQSTVSFTSLRVCVTVCLTQRLWKSKYSLSVFILNIKYVNKCVMGMQRHVLMRVWNTSNHTRWLISLLSSIYRYEYTFVFLCYSIFFRWHYYYLVLNKTNEREIESTQKKRKRMLQLKKTYITEPDDLNKGTKREKILIN
jgi:hypothetical protein